MDLLDDLGAQLRALTSDQPAQPGDRVPAVTRTARRIRRTRAAVAVATAVAVLAPAGLLVSSVQHHEATSFANSDVLSWPDRSLAENRTVANGALAAVEQQVGTSVDDDLRWLYRGRVPLPDGNPAYLAVFTVTVQAQHLLFTATSIGTQLDSQGRSGSSSDELPWAVDKLVLGDGKAIDHVGVYFSYSADGQGFDNLSVLLADPRARAMTWESAPIPFAPQVERGSTTAPDRSQNGVFVTRLGPLTGPVTATVSDAHGHRVTYPLASGASHVDLVQSAVPDLPPGAVGAGGGSAVTERDASGAWVMPSFSDGSANVDWPHREWTVYVRCYGGGEINASLVKDVRGVAYGTGRVACDGVSRPAFPPVRVSGNGFAVSLASDRLQAVTYRFAGVS